MSWIRATQFFVPYYAPTEHGPIVYMNAVQGNDPAMPPDSWITAEMPSATIDPSGIADDAVAVQLGLILIVTNGTAADLNPDLIVVMRRWLPPELPYEPDYLLQAESVVGGSREPASITVSVDARRFQYKWKRSTPPPWPLHASYGFKMYVTGYWRP